MRLTRWAVPGTAFGVLVAALAGCGGGANNIFNPSQPSRPSSTSQPSQGATPPAETVFVSDSVGVASRDVGPDVIDVFNSHISNGGKFTAEITNSNMTTAYYIATFGGSIYVSNAGQEAPGPGAAVFVFPQSANGPSTPTRKISGPSSQLVAPQGIAVDNSGNIYVADSTGGPNGNGQVDIYAPNSNAPLRTLGGQLSQIDQPTGIAVDSQGDVFVANDAGSVGGTGSLLEFAPGAGYNTAPIFVYGNGQLSAPFAVTLDDVGNILVSCDGNNQIVEFAVVRQGRVDRAAVANDDAVGLETRQHLAVVARPEHDQVGRAALPDAAIFPVELHDLRRHRGRGRDPVAVRMVEMGDLHRLGEALQHVVVAIGVEWVAHVVAADRDFQAMRLRLV